MSSLLENIMQNILSRMSVTKNMAKPFAENTDMHVQTLERELKKRNSYLNMLVISIPTNIIFTGNHTCTNLRVSGSVEIIPKPLKMDTITTDTKFCKSRKSTLQLDRLNHTF